MGDPTVRAFHLAALLSLCAPGLAAQDEVIEGHPYRKLETRAATLERMRGLLLPSKLEWGTWYAIGAFPYPGFDQGALALRQGPELELERMAVDGPGPDLERVYEGKGGSQARWRPLGDISHRPVDLFHTEAQDLSQWVSAYLYTTVTAAEAVTVQVPCGSDDGLRIWLNGELLLDNDVPRGLNAEDELVPLAFRPGTNHLLAKVGQGLGGWQFQMNYRAQLSNRADALLDFLLDRDFPLNRERLHYQVLTIPVPEDVALEVGGLDFALSGAPMVATRRGDVYRVEGAYEVPPLEPRFRRFATGLHEPLGLAVRAEQGVEAVYAVQRPELTRLVDEDGDGRADLYACVSDAFGVSGNYHEFAFGPEFDAEGNAWITLNVGFCGSLGKSVVPYRGWALKVTPSGETIPVASGLRSPNGIGAWTDGAMFYVDNQGDYVATNWLSFLGEGTWHGHPSSLRWREDHERWETPAPVEQPTSEAEAVATPTADPAHLPERQLPAVWFPYGKMGQSAADIALDRTGGAFGPFAGQLFVGDQTRALVMRVYLEKVNGRHQGACFPFVEALQCGVNRVAFAPDGSMFVGQTDRGWGSVGSKPYGLQRIVYTGKVPFEILAMRAQPDGFELELTQDVDPASAVHPGSYSLKSYTYEYTANYGAPEHDTQPSAIAALELRGPRRVFLRLPELRTPYVYELDAPGLRSTEGDALLHARAYYSLVERPQPAKVEEHRPPPPVVTDRTEPVRVERAMTSSPEAIYRAWTERLDLWIATPDTVSMEAAVNAPYYFETQVDGERESNYGRFLRLEPYRALEVTWVSRIGTRGFETVVTLELETQGEGTLLRLTHAGFPDEASRERYLDTWPRLLDELDRKLREERER